MANATSTQLQELYIAYFGRPADPEGLDYWTFSGISTKAFAENMYLQPEFIDVNGSLSIQEQINNLYLNLFARDADEEGLNYWTTQIVFGNLVLASIANDLIWAAQNNDGSEDDRACLANKTNAAVAFTVKAKGIVPKECLLVFPPICYKSTYEPENKDPWIDGRIFENVKNWMSNICEEQATTIPVEELLEGGSKQYRKWESPIYGGEVENLLTVSSQNKNLIFNNQENNESIHIKSNQILTHECNCENEFEVLEKVDYKVFGPLINCNIDSLVDHSPYGLISSNNTVFDFTVNIDNFL